MPSKFLVTDRDGNEIHPGDRIVDFRGKKATFVRAVRARDEMRSGKITVVENGQEWTINDKVYDLMVQAVDDA